MTADPCLECGMGYIEKLKQSARRKKAIIRLYQRDHKQVDIARKYGMHRQQVNRILKQAGIA